MSEMTLYNIAEEFRKIQYLLDESGGEITDEIASLMNDNAIDFERKCDGYTFILKKYDDNISLVDKEIERLEELKKRETKKREALAKRLVQVMEMFEIKKVETPLVTLSLRSSESIVIENADLIPDEYKTTTTEILISKTKIKEALNNGTMVFGAKSVEKNSLQIK